MIVRSSTSSRMGNNFHVHIIIITITITIICGCLSQLICFEWAPCKWWMSYTCLDMCLWIMNHFNMVSSDLSLPSYCFHPPFLEWWGMVGWWPHHYCHHHVVYFIIDYWFNVVCMQNMSWHLDICKISPTS